MSLNLQNPHPLRADPFYHALKEYLIASTGLAYYRDREDDLAARVAARLGSGAYAAARRTSTCSATGRRARPSWTR